MQIREQVLAIILEAQETFKSWEKKGVRGCQTQALIMVPGDSGFAFSDHFSDMQDLASAKRRIAELELQLDREQGWIRGGTKDEVQIWPSFGLTFPDFILGRKLQCPIKLNQTELGRPSARNCYFSYAKLVGLDSINDNICVRYSYLICMEAWMQKSQMEDIFAFILLFRMWNLSIFGEQKILQPNTNALDSLWFPTRLCNDEPHQTMTNFTSDLAILVFTWLTSKSSSQIHMVFKVW